jgi:hypothetical protein
MMALRRLCAMALLLSTSINMIAASTYFLNQKIFMESNSSNRDGLTLDRAFTDTKVAFSSLKPGDTLEIVGTLANPSYNASYNFTNVSDPQNWHGESSLTISSLQGGLPCTDCDNLFECVGAGVHSFGTGFLYMQWNLSLSVYRNSVFELCPRSIPELTRTSQAWTCGPIAVDNHRQKRCSSFQLTSTGAPGAWITIKAHDNTTRLKGDGGSVLRIMKSRFLRIQGLHIYGEVERIPNSVAKALQFVYKDQNGTIVHRVDRTLTDKDIMGLKLDLIGTVPRPSYTDTIGIYVSNSDHIEVLDNVVHHMPGGGIRVSYSEYVDIVGNNVHDCARKSSSGTHAVVATYTSDILPEENGSKYRVRILRNVIHNNYNEIYSWVGTKPLIVSKIDEGKGISLQRNQEFKNGGRILVANNLAYWNGFSGVHSNDGDNIDFVANTCYMNSYTNTVTYKGADQSGNNVGLSFSGGENCTMYNNIAVIDTSWNALALSIVGMKNVRLGSNLVHGIGPNKVRLDPDVEPFQDRVFVGDPLFVNATAFNFSIASESSPAFQKADPRWVLCEDLQRQQRRDSTTIGALEFGSPGAAKESRQLAICYHAAGTMLPWSTGPAFWSGPRNATMAPGEAPKPLQKPPDLLQPPLPATAYPGVPKPGQDHGIGTQGPNDSGKQLPASTYFLNQKIFMESNSSNRDGLTLDRAFTDTKVAFSSLKPGDTLEIVGTLANPSYNASYNFTNVSDPQNWHGESSLTISSLQGGLPCTDCDNLFECVGAGVHSFGTGFLYMQWNLSLSVYRNSVFELCPRSIPELTRTSQAWTCGPIAVDNHRQKRCSSFQLTSTGAPGAWITIKAHDNTTRLKGDGGSVLRIMKSRFLRIQGLHIYGEVERIPNSVAKALQFVYKDQNGTIVHRVDRTLTDKDIMGLKLDLIGTVPRPSYTDTIGIYVSNSDHIEVLDNVVHHMPGGGIRVSYSEYVDIVGNNVHDCARKSSSGTHAVVATYTSDILPEENGSKYRVRILRNVIHNNYNEIYSWVGTKPLIVSKIDEGKGISLQRNQEFKNGGRILVANNLAYWNGFSGVHSNDGDNIDFVANTCYMNSYTNTVTYKGADQSGNNVGLSFSGGENCTMYNNIAVIDTSWNALALSIVGMKNVRLGSNLVHGIGPNKVRLDPDVEPFQDRVFVGDPLFVNATAFNFSIASESSPAFQKADPRWVLCEDLQRQQRRDSTTIGALEFGSPGAAKESRQLAICYHAAGTMLPWSTGPAFWSGPRNATMAPGEASKPLQKPPQPDFSQPPLPATAYPGAPKPNQDGGGGKPGSKDRGKEVQQPAYALSVGEWTKCSKTCGGGGTQARSVKCRNKDTGTSAGAPILLT